MIRRYLKPAFLRAGAWRTITRRRTKQMYAVEDCAIRQNLSLALGLLFSMLLSSPTLATVEDENSLLSAGDAARYESSELAQLEPRALSLAGNSAARRGNQLRVRLRSGSVKTYENSASCASSDPAAVVRCEAYYLIAYARSRRLFVIYQGKYEGGSFLLVDDDTGAEQKVADFPLFFPGGTRILILKNSDLADSGGIEIWRHVSNQLKLEWSGSPSDTGQTSRSYYHLDRWISESQFRLRSETYQGAAATPAVKLLRFRFGDHGWQVTTANPK